MWFCEVCKDIVEKNITDLKIEKRCNEFMKSYEDRISRLEERIEDKCDESRVWDIVREEINKMDISDRINPAKDVSGQVKVKTSDGGNRRKTIEREQSGDLRCQ
jgi:hypothetical protein